MPTLTDRSSLPVCQLGALCVPFTLSAGFKKMQHSAYKVALRRCVKVWVWKYLTGIVAVNENINLWTYCIITQTRPWIKGAGLMAALLKSAAPSCIFAISLKSCFTWLWLSDLSYCRHPRTVLKREVGNDLESKKVLRDDTHKKVTF